ncbi:hypothetical protein OG488_05755 [Streptomyces sp. NBC_01460]|uniref:hypothetical protein n=1 Tax=Streptomyces sp. NBC_01460 TaxID=2903875 RepID=UPI002E316C96|nr:hypothetical protein [Streptomyces sp. NBC_01460]
MFDGLRNNRALRRITDAWFWEDVYDAVSDLVRSRSVWVFVGNAGTFACALAALLYFWSRPLSFAGCAVVQLVCLLCQAVALIPVVWPAPAATPRDVAGLSDLHQGMTVATVCGSWIFGVLPGAGLLTFLDVDPDGPRWAAVFLSGTALMMACVAGLITATAVSGTVVARRRAAAGPPDVSDWGDSADADSGGSDGD